MPLTNQQFLITYVIPGTLGLILAIIALRPWSSDQLRGFWAAPVAMGLGMACGIVGRSWPTAALPT